MAERASFLVPRSPMSKSKNAKKVIVATGDDQVTVKFFGKVLPSPVFIVFSILPKSTVRYIVYFVLV